MQTVLIVIKRYQQHVPVLAMSSVDPPLEEAGNGAGLIDELDAWRRRAERPDRRRSFNDPDTALPNEIKSKSLAPNRWAAYCASVEACTG